ncbi:MAG: hypothetical protein B7Z02_16675 [Rhodobacterales bacterium 32-67-9]|nr:MAG: hypothetical protein B7Z02_16675 [Rhodobacterales bacterium 32-67-9]
MRALLLALLFAAGPGPGLAACRQALVIGLDVSGSVDAREFLFQVRGLAQALRSDRIRPLLLERPEVPVMLAVFDWSGEADQRLILPWTAIGDAATLDRAAATIAATIRIPRSPATGVGAALLFGDGLLTAQEACWRLVLDLAGDGLNNSGPQPRDVTLAPRARPVTVNALVVGVNRDAGWDGGDPGIAELTAWFADEVIRGPDAFVEAALGYQDFAAAMERKLLKELSGIEVSSLSAPERSRAGAGAGAAAMPNARAGPEPVARQ